MKKFNIPKIAFPKMNINKDSLKFEAKILLGLFSLGLCLKAGDYFMCASIEKKRAQDEFDRNTLATLMDKGISPAKDNPKKNHVIIWLDADGDRKTAEAFGNMPDATPEQVLAVYNMTNGTTKSLADWKRLALPYKVHYTKGPI